jgi:hypothetical protein
MPTLVDATFARGKPRFLRIFLRSAPSASFMSGANESFHLKSSATREREGRASGRPQ